MPSKNERNRISGFFNGFLSSSGITFIFLSLINLASTPSNATSSINLALVGILTFVGGVFREAYIWGKFHIYKSPLKKAYNQPGSTTCTAIKMRQTRTQIPKEPVDPNQLIAEQIIECPVGHQTNEVVLHQQEQRGKHSSMLKNILSLIGQFLPKRVYNSNAKKCETLISRLYGSM